MSSETLDILLNGTLDDIIYKKWESSRTGK